jgi:hypothetical protein
MTDVYALAPPNSKISEELVKKICSYIATGNYISVACEAAGIDKATFYRWIEWAEQGKEPYTTLATELKKAEAEAETNRVAKLHLAGDKSWQANAWLLERKQPDRWGQTQRIHQTVDMSPEAKSYMAALTQANKQLVIEGEYKALPEGVTKGVTPASETPTKDTPD